MVFKVSIFGKLKLEVIISEIKSEDTKININ